MKIIIKYTLALTAVLLGKDFLVYNYLWKTGSALINILPYFLIIGLFIYTGIYELKKKKYDGEISYKDASLNGLAIMLCTAIVYSLMFYFVFPFGNPAFKEEFLARALEVLQNNPSFPKEDIPSTMQKYKHNLQPFVMAQSEFITILIFGTITSLLSASIQRKKIDIPPSS